MLEGLAGGYQTNSCDATSLGERNDDHARTNLADCDPAIPPVVVSLVRSHDHRTREDVGRGGEVDSMLRQVGASFSLVPLEVNSVRMYVHGVRTICKTPLDSGFGVTEHHMNFCRDWPDSCN